MLDDLNLALKPHGLQFAPDISTSNRATIGGMIANNSSGARSVLYGKTIDHVLELKVVLSDGSIVHLEPLDAAELEAKCAQQRPRRRVLSRGPRGWRPSTPTRSSAAFPRSCAAWAATTSTRSCLPTRRGSGDLGFNLARLFVGSEGTLGMTVEAKLRLVELPRARATLVVEFADLLEALAATPLILRASAGGGRGRGQVRARQHAAQSRGQPAARFPQGDPAAILLIEFYGERAEDLPPRLAALEDELAAQRARLSPPGRSPTPAAQARVWKLRTMALGLSMAEKGDAKAISFVEDTAVAPEHLRDYIAEFLAIIARHGTTAGVYAHASVGCLHVRPVINLKTEEGVQQFEAIAEEVADLVLKYGGALSGEHGDGLVRSPFQEKMYGPVLYQAFRELKQTFDPHSLLNPGKIVDAPPLATNLRYGPGYVTPTVPTTFDFSADGGLLAGRRAVRGRRRVPQEARGDDVPVVPGDARGEGQHARPGQPAAAGDHRPARLRGLHRPGRPRGARPLPRVQGVQERVPDQRRHGPAQGRVPASISSQARLPAAEPRLRPRRRAGPDRCALGARCRTGWHGAGRSAG